MAALAQPYALIEWAGNPDSTYPMQTVPEFPADPHRLIIELSDDFVNPRTDGYVAARQIDPICGCGRHLHYDGPVDWFGTDKIYRICPDCGTSFRPQDHAAELVDGETGATIPQPGGLCHRFAIIVYFGKDMPLYLRDSGGKLAIAKPRVTDMFLSTCTSALGIELNGFDDYS